MTVEELIAELQQMPQDAMVFGLEDYEDEWERDILRVEYTFGKVQIIIEYTVDDIPG